MFIPDMSIMTPPIIGPESGSLLFAAKLRINGFIACTADIKSET
jgi:hypothetical protein